MPDQQPEIGAPVAPLPVDLPALIAADRARRVKAAETEIAAALARHRCRLVTTQIITDGQAGPLEIRVTSAD